MWICLNNAFLSVTEDNNDPTRLMVRSRNPEHLRAVFGPGVKIIVTPERDYHYRTFIDRKEFAALMASKIEDIDYGNFKDSVEDKDLHDMYLDFWQTHFWYQQDVEEKAEQAAVYAKEDNKPVRGKPSLPTVDELLDNLKSKKK